MELLEAYLFESEYPRKKLTQDDYIWVIDPVNNIAKDFSKIALYAANFDGFIC